MSGEHHDGDMPQVPTVINKEVPRTEWPTTTAAQAMIQIEQTKRVKPDAELWAALEEMDRDGVNQLPVMADGTNPSPRRRSDDITPRSCVPV
jgi:CBS domain-containing protein